MKTTLEQIIFLTLISTTTFTSSADALSAISSIEMPIKTKIYLMEQEDEEPLPLHIKKEKEEEKGNKPFNTPVSIPKVSFKDHQLHFITPCNGCSLRLVQDNEVSYENIICGNTMALPSLPTGIYELQIVRGEFIFYTEINL